MHKDLLEVSVSPLAATSLALFTSQKGLLLTPTTTRTHTAKCAREKVTSRQSKGPQQASGRTLEISLDSHGWPGAHCVDQDALKPKEILLPQLPKFCG